MELNIIKQDVVNELRNQRYFNETEITRLVTSEAMSHKNRVNQLTYLVTENVKLIEAVKLMELYFPTAQQPVAPIIQASTDQQ